MLKYIYKLMQNMSILRAIVNCILPDTSDLHFYGQELFTLLLVLYNLKSCKNSSVMIKVRDNPERCARQTIQSSFLWGKGTFQSLSQFFPAERIFFVN